METYVKCAIVISCLFIPFLIFFPPSQLLVWLTLFIIIVNAAISVLFLLKTGKTDFRIIALNFIQLILFIFFHYLVYSAIGHWNYSYDTIPAWYDWPELVLVHAFKAIDFIDFFEEYGIYLQNLEIQSPLAGLSLVGMNILVDIFIFSALLHAYSARFPHPDEWKWQNVLFDWFNRMRIWIFGFLTIIFFLMFLGYMMKDIYHANPLNLILWPIDNILRIMDVGDALQIFHYRLHTMKPSFALATMAICFRIVVSYYIIRIIAHFSIHIFKGRGKTVEELGEIYASKEYSKEERIIAANTLKKFGANAAPAVPFLCMAFETSLKDIRLAGIEVLINIGPYAINELVRLLVIPDHKIQKGVIDTLDKIDKNWQKSEQAKAAVKYLIFCLTDKDIQARGAAEKALNIIDSRWPESNEAIEALPGFINSLNDPDPDIRQGACEALAIMGKNASLAIFRLVKKLVDANGKVRYAAYTALEKIDPRWQKHKSTLKALPFLVESLVNEDTEISESARLALLKTGASAVPFLVKALKTCGKKERRKIMAVLEKLRPETGNLKSKNEING